jgi:hypothetical protein
MSRSDLWHFLPYVAVLGFSAWLLMGSSTSQAQTKPAVVAQAIPTPDSCRKEVLRFEETIAFVRQAQGNEAAAAVKERLLPAKVANDLLLNEGYCGLARHLKERGL